MSSMRQMRGETVVSSVDDIINEARNGRMFLLIDDEAPETGGDLIIPAQMATPAAINFMASKGRGLICLALTRQKVSELKLDLMERNNPRPDAAAFTLSIEAKEGVSTGISAGDRAHTIAVAIDASRGLESIVTPGHVFPLCAEDGGVLVRAGHTEAAVDVARLAGLNPSGVICQILDDSGGPARFESLLLFAQEHGLAVGSIKDLIAYRRRYDHFVERVAESSFESDYGGAFTAKVYRNKLNQVENLVLHKSPIVRNEPTLVRMHTINPFYDLLGKPGPRKQLLQKAMRMIGEADNGVIVLLRTDTGKELSQKIASVEGVPDSSLRAYGIGAQILADLDIHEMILLTNTDREVVGIEGYGINVVGRRRID